ncbi:MAG: hypothetical protein ACYCW5_04470 [Thermoleophilia bacterium]
MCIEVELPIDCSLDQSPGSFCLSPVISGQKTQKDVGIEKEGFACHSGSGTLFPCRDLFRPLAANLPSRPGEVFRTPVRLHGSTGVKQRAFQRPYDKMVASMLCTRPSPALRPIRFLI